MFPQGKKKVWKVSTDDGGQTTCCDEHLWSTSSCRQRDPSVKLEEKWSVRDFKTIRNSLKYNGKPVQLDSLQTAFKISTSYIINRQETRLVELLQRLLSITGRKNLSFRRRL